MELFFWHMKDEVHLENCLTFEQLGKEFNDYMDYCIIEAAGSI